jgi:hypothetical protein
MPAKPRATWWIVSTHVLTTGFAMPLLASIIAAFVLVAAPFALSPIAQLLVMLGAQAIGYLAGTCYSLAYLRTTATVPRWTACTRPCFIAFAVLATLALGFNIAVSSGDPVVFTIATAFYATITVIFTKITASAFRTFDAQNL